MIRDILVFIIFFYILVLLQVSFFVHFPIFGVVPNLILISVIIINLLKMPREDNLGFCGAIMGGFFWDIFSKDFLGFHILILLILTSFLRVILKRYLRPVG